MAADLPKEFDVVVLGTGMPESIVAAAFSRIGQSVLHLDRNEFYSGDWASFSLKAIERWIEDNKAGGTTTGEDKLSRPSVEESSLLEEGETLVQLPLYNSSFSHVEAKYIARKEDVTEETSADKDVSQITTELAKVSHESEASDKQGGAIDTVKDATDNTPTDGTEITKPDEQTGDTKLAEDSTKEETTSIAKDGAKGDSKQESDTAVQNVTEKSQEATCTDNVCDKDNSNKLDTASGDGGKEEKADPQAVVVDKTEEAKAKKVWTVNKLKSEWRKFNIDISPKLLFSGGDMVDLLISSDIAKYCEFKTVTRILTVLKDKLEVVPCSRAGVFSSTTLSMLEKRMLMKFLQFCAEYESKQDELTDFMDKPFVEFLASKKLSATVRHFIQHSIAMATDVMTTRQGLYQMRKFLTSLGRYGNTSFLWSLYGSGELPQSYCRMCAVFGGIYCLRMSASSLILDGENRCTGVVTTEGQRIKCKWLIMENSYAPDHFLGDQHQKTMSRAVIMTDAPLLPSGQHELSQMCLPCPDDGDRPVMVLELPPSCLSSPSGIYIFHLTRQGKDGTSPNDDLAYAVNLLFKHDDDNDEDCKPTILWSLYFCQRDTSQVSPSDRLPDNVVLMSGPGMDIDIDTPVQEAKGVFQRILPEEEFLPKAPNPEDIVYIDDEETKVADGSKESEFTDSDKQGDENQSDSKPDEDQSDSKKDESQSDPKTENQSDSDLKTEDQSDSKIDVDQSDSKAEESADNKSDSKVTECLEDQTQDKVNGESQAQSSENPDTVSKEEASSQSVMKEEK